MIILLMTLGIIVNLMPANAAGVKLHWADEYAQELVKQKIIQEQTDLDSIVMPGDFLAALSKVLGKEIIELPSAEMITRSDMLKIAIDNSTYKDEMMTYEFQIFCNSNDEQTIDKEYWTYFNMGFRPQFDLMTYRPGRKIEAKLEPTWGEAAYLLYKLRFPPNRDPGQEITVNVSSEPDTINPFTTNALSFTQLATFMSSKGDVGIDNQANLYPEQALEVPTVDNGDIILFKDPTTGKDKMKVVWKIRPKMYWPPLDGEEEGSKIHEITADDYLFSLKVSLSPRVQSTTRTGLYKIDYARKIDKYTVEVGYNQLYTYANWGFGNIYKDMFERDFYTNPGDFNVREDFYTRDIGPYKMVVWDRGDHMEFTPNPYALYASPLISKVYIKFISDPNTVRINLQSGDLDVVAGSFDPIDVDYLEKKVPNIKFYLTEGTSWAHIDLDQYNDKDGQADYFADKRVRQAMLYALDREQESKIISNGVWKPAHSWLSRSSRFYNEKILKIYQYNPKKAEKLLDEAGWKLTKIGNEYIRCKDGDVNKPFKVKITGASESVPVVKNLELMTNYWKQIGLQVDPQPMSAKQMLGGDFLRKHQFEMIQFSWVSNAVRPNSNLWRWDQIPTESNNWEGQCVGGWRGSDEHEQICKEIEKILPDSKLHELFDAQAKIWCEELPALPLYNRYDIDAVKRDIKNIKPTGSTVTINWNCAFWYKELKTQPPK